MDNDTLARSYKFFERKEGEFSLYDELKLFMEDYVIDELKRQDLIFLRIELNNEFEQIQRGKDYPQEHILKGVANSINIPVNIKMIIK